MVMAPLVMDASTVGPGTFLGWGAVTVSLGNFIVIVTMVVLFVAALLVPFLPDRHRR
ncbi:hypothetical protein [Amnibacterium sp.]|uniref:hypothetical protein n=1 Tax=Amnibacterium sp. TaxID=1872496 RepID=UPI003F7C0A6C